MSATTATKGGVAAKWLGMRCAEPAFRDWLTQTFPAQADVALGRNETERTASVIRAVCGIESRAEIDNDDRANQAFQTLIREPWIAHQGITE